MSEEVKEVKKPATKKVAPKAEGAAKTPAKPKAPAKPKVEEAPKEEKAEAKPKAAPKKKAAIKTRELSRLEARYVNDVRKGLMEKYSYTSVMEIPLIHKVVINVGVGDAATNSKVLEDSVNELALITGQKPITTKAKNSIAGFKLREGVAIGCKVTLRGTRMYEFLDKLINIALPRVRDFRGLSPNAFDGRGNYTLGVKEQLIFPEIDYDKIHKIRGMDISIVTSAKTDGEAHTLLALLGMPFAK